MRGEPVSEADVSAYIEARKRFIKGQEWMAARIGVCVETIQRLEAGDVYVSPKIADDYRAAVRWEIHNRKAREFYGLL